MFAKLLIGGNWQGSDMITTFKKILLDQAQTVIILLNVLSAWYFRV